MDLKQTQTLIFLLLLVPVWTSGKMFRCYSDTKLRDAAERKLRSLYPQPAERSAAVARDAPAPCPVNLYQLQPPLTELSDRSLSPWRYVNVTKEDHFPSTYAEAQCLCSGCIQIQKDGTVVESHDYNSVSVKQSRVFLKRERCRNGKSYYLKPVNVQVNVGCTCARVKSIH